MMGTKGTGLGYLRHSSTNHAASRSMLDLLGTRVNLDDNPRNRRGRLFGRGQIREEQKQSAPNPSVKAAPPPAAGARGNAGS